jgi:hypothetical protein
MLDVVIRSEIVRYERIAAGHCQELRGDWLEF